MPDEQLPPDDELPPEEQTEQPLTNEEMAQAEDARADHTVGDPIWPDDPVSPQYSSASVGSGPCFPHGIPEQSRNVDAEEEPTQE